MWLVEIGSIFILTYTRLPLPSYLSWHLAHRSLYHYIDLWYSRANKPPPFILSSTSATPVYLLLASSFLISGPASPDLSTTSLISLYLFSSFLLGVCSKFVYLQASKISYYLVYKYFDLTSIDFFVPAQTENAETATRWSMERPSRYAQPKLLLIQ